jgi:transcriptional regulator with XRE-family HTH domain
MATFGERIREQRKRAGLTLEQLAEASESSKSYIWELENKNPPRPSAAKISKIAKALNVTTDYLINDGEELESAQDAAFFRKYSSLSPSVKDKIRQFAKMMDE